MRRLIFLGILLQLGINLSSQDGRLRDYEIVTGIMSPGRENAITDVAGVRVGHVTLIVGDSVRTGVTAILPHNRNIYREKVPAAIYIGNGYGKLTGISQVQELGNIETPIMLTNTLSVPAVSEGVISYMLNLEGNGNVRSINPIVGETNDGSLNDIRGRYIREEHVMEAIANARSGMVPEGNVGAGTGTVCFGFKGGIGTSSRVLTRELGGYTVGVLVQTNFGGVLQIDGVPVGVELDQYYLSDIVKDRADGSCMIVVITDAPVDSRNLERMAKRAIMGLAKTGGIASNGSGDYVIAVSVYEENLIREGASLTYKPLLLHNSRMSPLFLATIEATEEAILNSLFAAETMTGRGGATVKALPVDRVVEIMKKYNRIELK